MGSLVEINDTLQLTLEQGFPAELGLERHLKEPIELGAVQDKVFDFRNKAAIRNFQQPPVRVFLVQNIGGKWVYWGLALVLEVTHDYVVKTTSGKFKFTKLNNPEEMKQAFNLIDGRPDFDYFG